MLFDALKVQGPSGNDFKLIWDQSFLSQFFPNSEALGSQSLNKAVCDQFWLETAPGRKRVAYGVNKALDGKGRFLKPDYHYTTIFLAS